MRKLAINAKTAVPLSAIQSRIRQYVQKISRSPDTTNNPGIIISAISHGCVKSGWSAIFSSASVMDMQSTRKKVLTIYSHLLIGVPQNTIR